MDPNFDLESFILHHLVDAQSWHLPYPIDLDISLPGIVTLHAAMLFVAAFILIFLFCFLYDKSSRVPRGITNVLESFVLFVRDEIAVANLGEKDGKKLTPLFCTLFFFILTLNLMGLIPVFSTATANISVTAGLALVTLGFMVFGSIFKNGFKGFAQSFVPSGVPAPILVILVPIEVIGMFIKVFALTIRLFANMLAGHIVIFSLLGLVVLLGAAALPSVFLALGIYLLEVLVAFLQAYIFTLLSAMFIGHMYHPQH